MIFNALGLTILDHDRKPVPCDDVIAWADWMESGPRNVGRDSVDRCTVLTNFMGTDLSFGLGRPKWFETMVFAPDADLVLGRYGSWDEAAAGHARVVGALHALKEQWQVPTARALRARLEGE